VDGRRGDAAPTSQCCDFQVRFHKLPPGKKFHPRSALSAVRNRASAVGFERCLLNMEPPRWQIPRYPRTARLESTPGGPIAPLATAGQGAF
jgi:hypothetical protein